MWHRLSDPRLLTRIFVCGGLILRLWHYVLNQPIWYDEAVLLANVMSKTYLELLGPLNNEVAAPPLYLWLLKCLYGIFGDQTYVWRAVAMIAGCANLFLLVPLARSLLKPHTAAFALGLLAVSDTHVRLCNTIRPYTLDALITTLMLLGLVRTGHWPLAKRLLLLAGFAPLALLTSYPAVFVVGGVLLAHRPNDRRSLAAWLVTTIIIVGTFAWLYFGPIHHQRVKILVNEWQPYYLPFTNLPAIPGWFLKSFVGLFQEMANPSGALLALLAPIAWWRFLRTGQERLAVAIAGTFLAVLVASAVRSYPFGQNRQMQFLAPMIYLLGSMGMEVLARWRLTPTIVLGVVIICIADGLSLWRMANPWAVPDARRSSRFVRDHRQPGEAIFSDEGNYRYYFHGEWQPLEGLRDLPPGRQAWVLMDHYSPEERRGYLLSRLQPLGMVLVEEHEFFRSGVYKFEKRLMK